MKILALWVFIIALLILFMLTVFGQPAGPRKSTTWLGTNYDGKALLIDEDGDRYSGLLFVSNRFSVLSNCVFTYGVNLFCAEYLDAGKVRHLEIQYRCGTEERVEASWERRPVTFFKARSNHTNFNFKIEIDSSLGHVEKDGSVIIILPEK